MPLNQTKPNQIIIGKDDFALIKKNHIYQYVQRSSSIPTFSWNTYVYTLKLLFVDLKFSDTYIFEKARLIGFELRRKQGMIRILSR